MWGAVLVPPFSLRKASEGSAHAGSGCSLTDGSNSQPSLPPLIEHGVEVTRTVRAHGTALRDTFTSSALRGLGTRMASFFGVPSAKKNSRRTSYTSGAVSSAAFLPIVRSIAAEGGWSCMP